MATKKTAKKRHALPVNLKSSRALEEKLTRKKAAKRKAPKPPSVLVQVKIGPYKETTAMPRETYERMQRLRYDGDTMCSLLELGIEAAELRDGNLPPHRDIERHRAVLRRLCTLMLSAYDEHSEWEDAETKAIELLRKARRELLL